MPASDYQKYFQAQKIEDSKFMQKSSLWHSVDRTTCQSWAAGFGQQQNHKDRSFKFSEILAEDQPDGKLDIKDREFRWAFWVEVDHPFEQQNN